MDALKEGDWVVIRINDGVKYISSQISKSEKIRVSKNQVFPSTKLIGKKYGEFYELCKGNILQPYEEHYENTEIPEDLSLIGDNREIPINSNAQELTLEEIESMKNNEELTPQEMIEKIKDNNKTFAKKTIFAQEKYLKKKKKKHLSILKLLQPNSRTLAEAFYSKGPSKVLFLRPDTLASILSYANIYSGRRVIVQENCSGLVAGTIVERMAGNGDVLNLYTEYNIPAMPVFRGFNFSAETLKSHLHYPFNHFKSLMDIPLPEIAKIKDDNSLLPFKLNARIPIDHIIRIRENFELFADSLVIATHHNPALILFHLFPFLETSGKLVIFHPQLQPLIDCHEMLKSSGEVICLDMHEIWLRDYQVLPKRTHPFMRMNACSGYILSAIKVLASDDDDKIQPPQKKHKTTDDDQQI